MAGQILHSFRVHTSIDLVLKELRVPVGESKKRSASEETLLENDIVPERTTILSAASTVRIWWAMTRTVFPKSSRDSAPCTLVSSFLLYSRPSCVRLSNRRPRA